MILIEKKFHKHYLHHKEVGSTFELAQITGQSPSKMHRLVNDSPHSTWIYIPGGEYRFRIKDLRN